MFVDRGRKMLIKPAVVPMRSFFESMAELVLIGLTLFMLQITTGLSIRGALAAISLCVIYIFIFPSQVKFGRDRPRTSSKTPDIFIIGMRFFLVLLVVILDLKDFAFVLSLINFGYACGLLKRLFNSSKNTP
jgi:hypothetical protein